MRSKREVSPQEDQRRRFEEAARALGCDEDEAAFKAKLAQITRQKVKDAPGKTTLAPTAVKKPTT